MKKVLPLYIIGAISVLSLVLHGIGDLDANFLWCMGFLSLAMLDLAYWIRGAKFNRIPESNDIFFFMVYLMLAYVDGRDYLREIGLWTGG